MEQRECVWLHFDPGRETGWRRKGRVKQHGHRSPLGSPLPGPGAFGLVNEPRRMARWVMRPNQRSTWLSQEEIAGDVVPVITGPLRGRPSS